MFNFFIVQGNVIYVVTCTIIHIVVYLLYLLLIYSVYGGGGGDSGSSGGGGVGAIHLGIIVMIVVDWLLN